jgi:hypothetical protein
MELAIDFSSNPDLPRVLQKAQDDFGITLQLSTVIEQVGDCIRLIGTHRANNRVTETIVPETNYIVLPCYADRLVHVKDGKRVIRVTEYTYDRRTRRLELASNLVRHPIEISYSVFPVDANGYPLIDSEEVFFACLHYCVLMYLRKQLIMTKQPTQDLPYVEQLYNKYVGQARSREYNLNMLASHNYIQRAVTNYTDADPEQR